MARKVGNLLALAVLSYLTQGPMHPYELSRTLRDNGDARSIRFNHGSLYMVVQQLARAGFIAAQETSRDGQRPEAPSTPSPTPAGPRSATGCATWWASRNTSTPTSWRRCR